MKDKYGVEQHALNSHTKYCRLIRKHIRNKQKWYLQLILKGKALQKKQHTITDDVVGIDIGPSTIAAVSTKEALIKPFCQEIVRDEEQIRKLQKKISRSLRLNNPQNYKKDRSVKQGTKQWNRTQRYKNMQQQVIESKRRLAETRRHLQGKMANQVLRMGRGIKLEKLSYKSLHVFRKGVIAEQLIRNVYPKDGTIVVVGQEPSGTYSAHILLDMSITTVSIRAKHRWLGQLRDRC